MIRDSGAYREGIAAVFADVLVWTTTLSPFLAVFESSFCISSPLTGLICAVGAAGLADDELFGGGGDVLEGLCCAAGLSCWFAEDGCCAQSGKLAKANRLVTSAVRVFMKNPPWVPPRLRIRTSTARAARFPIGAQPSCQTRRGKPGTLCADCPRG